MTEKVCIEIDTSGAAFEKAPAAELAALLSKLARCVRDGDLPAVGESIPLMDTRGQVAGYCSIRETRRSRR